MSVQLAFEFGTWLQVQGVRQRRLEVRFIISCDIPNGAWLT